MALSEIHSVTLQTLSIECDSHRHSSDAALKCVFYFMNMSVFAFMYVCMCTACMPGPHKDLFVMAPETRLVSMSAGEGTQILYKNSQPTILLNHGPSTPSISFARTLQPHASIHVLECECEKRKCILGSSAPF